MIYLKKYLKKHNIKKIKKMKMMNILIKQKQNNNQK